MLRWRTSSYAMFDFQGQVKMRVWVWYLLMSLQMKDGLVVTLVSGFRIGFLTFLAK